MSATTLPATTRPAGATASAPTRTLSGLKPTGPLQLGNLLSAVRPLARASRASTSPDQVLVMVADLHALTVPHDPARLRRLTREVAALRIAMRDTATRDFVRSELRDLLDEMADRGLVVARAPEGEEGSVGDGTPPT